MGDSLSRMVKRLEEANENQRQTIERLRKHNEDLSKALSEATSISSPYIAGLSKSEVDAAIEAIAKALRNPVRSNTVRMTVATDDGFDLFPERAPFFQVEVKVTQ